MGATASSTAAFGPNNSITAHVEMWIIIMGATASSAAAFGSNNSITAHVKERIV